METKKHLEGAKMVQNEKLQPKVPVFVLGKQSLNAELKILRKFPGKNPSVP